MTLNRLALLAVAIPFCLGTATNPAQARQPSGWRANIVVRNRTAAPIDVYLDGTPAFVLAVTIPAGGKSKFTGLLEEISYTVSYDLDRDGILDQSFLANTVRGTTPFIVYP